MQASVPLLVGREITSDYGSNGSPFLTLVRLVDPTLHLPFGRATARRLLDSLQLRPLLDGQRDRPALDVDAFCEAAERFSVMAAGLAGSLDEVDINPVIVLPDGCTAVDALVVARKASPSDTPG